ncbi:MAG: polysaccharide deacetylase family protein [Candidatus Hydrogenedentes bacterium]|nr:polysaccharide deacetylase family protein [Candidatus Hydrogenedentota bacterium]
MRTHALLVGVILGLIPFASRAQEPVPDKTVVLTFDDAVKSHLSYVAPMLKEYGFGATFFVCHLWMNDTENFMSWEDIATLHKMGFEIGNHSWTHPNFAEPEAAARIAGEMALVENELGKVGVPKPVSFAWTGNGFGPEALQRLRKLGYKFARRGMQPEVPYGKLEPGPLYEPRQNDPLLIPTSRDGYPDCTLEDIKRVVEQARDGRIAVLQFHGVPDVAHPWVHTPPEKFREYMQYLHDGGYHVIAMRDVEKYIPAALPKDPMIEVRYPAIEPSKMKLPQEVTATRADLPFWLDNMLVQHAYSVDEAAEVCWMSPQEIGEQAGKLGIVPGTTKPSSRHNRVRVLPYPGGRHPRIGFLEGAIDPLRGTKASAFLPWKGGGYVVVDLPEAIFSNLGLTYLAHTHVPTIWNEQNVVIENVDWTRDPKGGLRLDQTLPNGVRFGSSITPDKAGADMELWLENGTKEPLTGMRTQICVMLKGAPGFNALTQERKTYDSTAAAVGSEDGKRFICVAFDRCGRSWGNEDVPCIHADPILPDAAPGERVSLKGRLWFYQGSNIERELRRVTSKLKMKPVKP